METSFQKSTRPNPNCSDRLQFVLTAPIGPIAVGDLHHERLDWKFIACIIDRRLRDLAEALRDGRDKVLSRDWIGPLDAGTPPQPPFASSNHAPSIFGGRRNPWKRPRLIN